MRVYDFVEFVWDVQPTREFGDTVNEVLERERSGYRLIEGRVVPITLPEEIEAVENAAASSVDAVRSHIQEALRLLSELDHPDYRNSVKESISAVEAACIHVTGKTGVSLGEAIKARDKIAPLHPALKEAWLKLYGWTSNDAGIRHALTDGDAVVDQHMARFMLVTCSAFANYLVATKA